MPLISLVIANYNYGRFLEGAIQSVLSQIGEGMGQVKPADVELIIIDGGSKDDSVDIIKKYADRLAYWVSEPDKGQSDAFNKGFSHAKGQFLTWLNADDFLVQGSLMAVVLYIKNHPEVEWLSGGVVFCDLNGYVEKMRIGAQPPLWMYKIVPMNCIGGPSSIFSRQRWVQAGKIDTGLHYIMDVDLWEKFFRLGMKLTHLNCYIWGFRVHEQSKTSQLIVSGTRCMQHERECHLIKLRYHRSQTIRCLGDRLWLVWKILTGALFRSYFDTKKYYASPVELLRMAKSFQGKQAAVTGKNSCFTKILDAIRF